MNRFFRRSAVPYIAAGLSVLFLCVQIVNAQETEAPELPDRFMIRGGYLFVFGADTDIQLNGQRAWAARSILTGPWVVRRITAAFESMQRIALTIGTASGSPIIGSYETATARSARI